MKNKIGIIYATVDGQTLKICKAIEAVLINFDNAVELISIDDFDGVISKFDKIIIGSSIRYGKHNAKVIDYIKENTLPLNEAKTAFFSVNLVARKEEKSSKETNPYVAKFFNQIAWNPTLVAVFAGSLDYPKYSFFDRIMIQLIMYMTKGPTNTKTQIEYTDWDKVRAFAKDFDRL